MISILLRVFNNRDFSELPYAPSLDTIMLLWQSQFGKIKFLDVVTGAYRFQSESAYSSKNESWKKDYALKTCMECMDLVTKSLYPKYQKMILKKLVELHYLDKSLYLERMNELKSFMKQYPERFSTWQSTKIFFIIAIMYLLDLFGANFGRSFILGLINKIMK